MKTFSALFCLFQTLFFFGHAVYNGPNKHTFATNYGKIEVGPFNSGWAYIYTDRPKIIFNKPVWTTANIFSSYNGDLVFQTNGSEPIRIDEDTGKVGIGTTDPRAKPQVMGDFYLYGNDSYFSAWGKNHIYWRRHSLIMGPPIGAYAHKLIELKPGGANAGPLHSAIEFYEALGEGEYEKRIRISSATSIPAFFNAINVGIGTSNPDAKLAVKGKIHAEEVKVDLSVPGPDYVFKEGYGLKSLVEVQTYIKEHRHWPNIPSAKEMEANGIQLGEMNMKLLEKIEELTIYTLEQEEKLKRMGVLEKKIAQWEKLMN